MCLSLCLSVCRTSQDSCTQTNTHTHTHTFNSLFVALLPSVLWRCWLDGMKSIRPVKTEWWGAGVVICLERDANLHMAQLMPLPLAVSCFSKIQIGFTLLLPAHPGSPGQRAIKHVCVCACVRVCVCARGFYLSGTGLPSPGVVVVVVIVIVVVCSTGGNYWRSQTSVVSDEQIASRPRRKTPRCRRRYP